MMDVLRRLFRINAYRREDDPLIQRVEVETSWLRWLRQTRASGSPLESDLFPPRRSQDPRKP
jgi:hypothetical protein